MLTSALPMSPMLVAIAGLAALNLATWATYRLDKARAVRGERRFRERTLLLLAALGGSCGALVAVYGHRHRHKARKAAFVVPLWLIVVAQLGVVAVSLAR